MFFLNWIKKFLITSPATHVEAPPENLTPETIHLVLFDQIPIDEYWSIDVAGKPGLAISQKKSSNSSRCGKSTLVMIPQTEFVWWRKSFKPEPDDTE